jgi:PD-(D/E)XK nuclease family transposase
LPGSLFPKFTRSADELSSGLDIWLYFLRHAEKMDTEALPAALQQPLVLRAVEELKMLTQTDLERERYEARRKAQLDHNTGLKVARMEGEKIGVIGTIHFCERFLQRQETSTEQLLSLSLEDLSRLANELQAEVLKQR